MDLKISFLTFLFASCAFLEMLPPYSSLASKRHPILPFLVVGSDPCEGVTCLFDAKCVDGGCPCPEEKCVSSNEGSKLLQGQVCASDLKLYPSECHMRMEACRRQEPLTIRPMILCQGKLQLYETLHYLVQYSAGLDVNPERNARYFQCSRCMILATTGWFFTSTIRLNLCVVRDFGQE